jgi:hypothetical protein
MLHVTNQTTGGVNLVSKEAWAETTTSLKEHRSSTIARLIVELEK